MQNFLNLLMTMNGGLLLHRGVTAWIVTSGPSSISRTSRGASLPALSRRHFHPSVLTLRNAWTDNDDDDDDWGGAFAADDQRIFRRGRQPQQQSSTKDRSWGGDYDDDYSQRRARRPQGRRNNNNNPRSDWRRRDKYDNQSRRNNNQWDRNNNNNNRNNQRKQKKGKSGTEETKIDMKGLEAEGFVHLYGLAPILSALQADKRDFQPRESLDDMVSSRFQETEDYYNVDEDDDFAFEKSSSEEKPATKPEAQFTPYLFIQDRSAGGSGRTGEKLAAATNVKQLAEDLGVPVAYTDKGSLNALSGNRPHQGFVLRCGPLEFEPLSRIPQPRDSDGECVVPKLWLVLDEVVDPQNLGALLRSSLFLGGSNNSRMGVLVCSKNSAPPSPVVSAASAGALELLDVYSTNSLPRTLASAREDGFRIIGAASSKPRGLEDDDDGAPLYDLQDLPLNNNNNDDNRPTLLVLGSEGSGLRTLVAKLCTEFVRIPHGDSLGMVSEDEDETAGSAAGSVDSLNVSVSGGILLWHLLHGGGAKQ